MDYQIKKFSQLVTKKLEKLTGNPFAVIIPNKITLLSVFCCKQNFIANSYTNSELYNNDKKGDTKIRDWHDPTLPLRKFELLFSWIS